MKDFVVVIPARYGSSRFPGKPLAEINDKPMIQHVYERAVASGASQVIVATDDQRIAETVAGFDGQVCMTGQQHESGTSRIAEVISIMGFDDQQVVVNVQGDEPFIPVANIAQVAENLAKDKLAVMATLAVQIESVEELFNPNVVKIVTDKQGYAMYFSRATLPYDRNRFMDADSIDDIGDYHMRHIGIYAYRAGFVRQYVELPPSGLEHIESLEQLRVLWHGEKIHVDMAVETPPVGVDTPADLAHLIKEKPWL